MDYKRIYDQIIAAAKIRKAVGYVEKHHIVPKCLGGDNSVNNLVALTPKEHYVCHRLLCEMYPKNKKLLYALSAMMIPSNGRYKNYRVSSRLYDHIKKELFYTRSNYLKKFNPMKDLDLREKRRVEMKTNNLYHRLTEEQKQRHKQNGSVAKMGSKNPRAKKCVWIETNQIFGSCGELMRNLRLDRCKEYYFKHGYIEWLV